MRQGCLYKPQLLFLINFDNWGTIFLLSAGGYVFVVPVTPFLLYFLGPLLGLLCAVSLLFRKSFVVRLLGWMSHFQCIYSVSVLQLELWIRSMSISSSPPILQSLFWTTPHSVQSSARFPSWEISFQIQNLLLFARKNSYFRIVLWHDTSNSCPLSVSNFLKHRDVQELIEEICLFAGTNMQWFTAREKLSPDIFGKKFLAIHAFQRLLRYRKLKATALVRRNNDLNLNIHLDFRTYFLCFKHINSLQQLPQKKTSSNEKRFKVQFRHLKLRQ